MGHTRPRYNAKGRGLVDAKQQKQKQDSNAEILPPVSAEERAARRKELLTAKNAESQSKISGKRKKRLDNYIDKKLAKDRRHELLDELAAYHKEIPDDKQMQTVSSLGSQNLFTAQEKVDRSERLQERRKDRLKASVMPTRTDVSSSEEEEKSTSAEASGKGQTGIVVTDGEQKRGTDIAASQAGLSSGQTNEKTAKLSQVSLPTQTNTPSFASGLKRAADGSIPAPIVVKRRKISRTERFPTSVSSDDDESGSENLSDEYESDDSDMTISDDEDDADSAIESWHGIPSSDEEENNPLSMDEDVPPLRQKGSFKQWADAQRDEREGFTQVNGNHPDQVSPPSVNPASVVPTSSQSNGQPQKKGSRLKGPLGEDINMTEDAVEFAKSFPIETERVTVHRPDDIKDARLELPILAEEDNIMFAIRHHPVIVLSGETGSGKTTQIPQFLYEAGFGSKSTGSNPGMIGITQPRRVAAISMANRVAQELALSSTSSVVGHQIRYDTSVSANTRIKFMTDGVLLRELGTDFLLSKYSVIVIDEAHERTVNTDILLGILSRVVRLRLEMWRKKEANTKPLRLVIMSATLRLTDFLSNKTLFANEPPCISVGARQFPVTAHFSRKTSSEYLEEAYKKVCRIHSRLPDGGILVFLTGQAEIISLCKRLSRRYGIEAVSLRKEQELGLGDGLEKDGREFPKQGRQASRDEELTELDLGHRHDLTLDVDESAPFDQDEDALSSASEQQEDETALTDKPMHVLPMYSLLPSDKQMRVFQPPPEGHRLVVVATNVAETSLTIPGIRYVVDAGRAKDKQYDKISGMQSFDVGWISKASAAQRSGRAGRTGPGHCYRLYSSAVYERYLEDHTNPEILQIPAESMVLQMKSMHIDIVANFPFPTPPDRQDLRKAETTLFNLGALDRVKAKNSEQFAISELGKAMSVFPLSPRFAKMLVTGQQHGCLPYVIAIVCALSIGSPFLQVDGADDLGQGQQTTTTAEFESIQNPEQKEKALRQMQRRQFHQIHQQHAVLGQGASDVFKLLSVIGAYEHEQGSLNFCQSHFVRPKAMEEIHKLRAQIGQLLQAHFEAPESVLDPRLLPPNDLQLRVLRQLVASSFIDQIAVRKDVYDKQPVRYTSSQDVAYRALGIDEDVFIHPTSSLYNRPPPEYVCFGEVNKTSHAYMRTVTQVSPNWLSSLGKPLCTYTKVLETPDQMLAPPSSTATSREVFVVPKFGRGNFEIELPKIKMTQRRQGARWVFA